MADVNRTENLKTKSDEELAKWQSSWKPESQLYILAEKEWERRARERQHELDVALILKQVRWMRYSVVASVVAALSGAVIGALLQAWLR